jgi:hypothetical protein
MPKYVFIKTADNSRVYLSMDFMFRRPVATQANLSAIRNVLRQQGSPDADSAVVVTTDLDAYGTLIGEQGTLDAIAALPAQIPVTVQGASEAFINSSLGQVIVNSNTNTNFLGASILNRRTEIINRINETHPS